MNEVNREMTRRMLRSRSLYAQLLGDLTLEWRRHRVPQEDFLRLTSDWDGKHWNGRATDRTITELAGYLDVLKHDAVEPALELDSVAL